MKLFEQVLTVVTYVSISFTTIASTEHYLNQKKGSPLFSISLGLAVSSFVFVLKHFFFMQEAVDKGKLNLSIHKLAREYGVHALNFFMILLLAEFNINESPEVYQFPTLYDFTLHNTF